VDIGERVKELRKSRGMTQRDLADAIKVNQVYVSRIETGRLKHVKPKLIKALSEVLDAPVDYLLLGEMSAQEAPTIKEQHVETFLQRFFSLDPSQRAQVMKFTDFISGEQGQKPDNIGDKT